MANLWTRHGKKTLFLASECDLDLGALDLGLALNTLSHDGQHFCRQLKIHRDMAKLWSRQEESLYFLFYTFDL